MIPEEFVIDSHNINYTLKKGHLNFNSDSELVVSGY